MKNTITSMDNFLCLSLKSTKLNTKFRRSHDKPHKERVYKTSYIRISKGERSLPFDEDVFSALSKTDQDIIELRSEGVSFENIASLLNCGCGENISARRAIIAQIYVTKKKEKDAYEERGMEWVPVKYPRSRPINGGPS